MEAGKLFQVAEGNRSRYRDHRVQATGEFRPPQKGEWFISGAIPEGYQAPSDLTIWYHIGRLVKVRIVETIEVIEDGTDHKG
jgi:hypothetical protein